MRLGEIAWPGIAELLALLDAETRIGELLKVVEPVSQRDDSGKITEWDNKLPEGISRNQSSAFQKMAEHKDVVEQVKAEAKMAQKRRFDRLIC